MRLVEERRISIVGLFLVLILLFNLAQQWVSAQQTNNNQGQVRQSLKLAESYGRLNAFSIEYIEMLNYDLLFSREPGFWRKAVKEVPEILDKIPENELDHWKDKTTRERFIYSAKKVKHEQRSLQQEANTLFMHQENFISKNILWNNIETFLSLIQIFLILIVIYLYFGLISSIHGRIVKPKK